MLSRIRPLGLVSFWAIVSLSLVYASQTDVHLHAELVAKQDNRLHIETLDNGMRVVCYTADNTNTVTVAVAVDVGFKDEKNEFGLAHILEHMMFKGTQTKGEGYINRLAALYGLSRGDFNAYTSPDHTFYFFNTDSNNWRTFGDIAADLLQNLDVTDDALHSELGAIAQEIKLHGYDQNQLNFGDLYPYNHPYSHLGIGYKEDVLSYTAEQVMNFYNTYYVADKSVFFVCGNVNPSEVFEYARQTFRSFTRRSSSERADTNSVLPFYAGLSLTKKTIYHPQLHRELSFMWQGACGDALYDKIALQWCAAILSKRLHDKWVDEAGMCFSVRAQYDSFKYAGIFSVVLQPKEASYAIDFDALLTDEIARLIDQGVTTEEYNAVFMAVVQGLVVALENPAKFLFQLAHYTGYDDIRSQVIRTAVAQRTMTPLMIVQAARTYLRPAVMNSEIRLPLPLSEWGTWENIQRAAGVHEAQLLSARARVAPDQKGSDLIAIQEPQLCKQKPDIDYQCITLSNGIQVYYHQDTTSDRRVFCLLHKNAAQWMLTKKVAGASGALAYWGDMLLHGNSGYTKKELYEYCATRGIVLAAGGGQISCNALKNNFDEALRLLRLSLDEPLLPSEILERKKNEYIESIAQSQNDLQYRFKDYVDSTLLKDMPGVFSAAGLASQIQATSMHDIQHIIDEMRDPRNVVGVLVGDCTQEEAYALAEKHFGSLQGDCLSTIQSYVVPPITRTVSGHVEVAHENSLVYALAPTCLEDDYDTPALILLAEYLEYKLWDVRERTGLFYACGATIKQGTSMHIGIALLAAMTIPGNVQNILEEMKIVLVNLYTQGLNDEQLKTFKENRMRRQGTYVHNAMTLTGNAIDALEQAKPFNYEQQFDVLVHNVTVEQVNTVIKKYFDPAGWSFITLGRS